MGRRLDWAALFIRYCQGIETNKPFPVALKYSQNGQKTTIYMPGWKKASYRDLAKMCGCTVRAIEKIGSKHNFYKRRKNMALRIP